MVVVQRVLLNGLEYWMTLIIQLIKKYFFICPLQSIIYIRPFPSHVSLVETEFRWFTEQSLIKNLAVFGLSLGLWAFPELPLQWEHFESWTHIQSIAQWTSGCVEENISPMVHVSQHGCNNMHSLGVSHKDLSGSPARAERPLSKGVRRGRVAGTIKYRDMADLDEPHTLTHRYTHRHTMSKWQV